MFPLEEVLGVRTSTVQRQKAWRRVLYTDAYSNHHLRSELLSTLDWPHVKNNISVPDSRNNDSPPE